MKNKTTLIGIAKNEGPYIWEWVAHHKAIGFDDIIIFQNDSTDLTHYILSALHDAGLVHYKYNQAKLGAHQVRAYIRGSKLPPYQNADYAMALDMDEFLVINSDGGTLDDFYREAGEFDAALINWVYFGNSNLHELRKFDSALPDLSLERFTCRTLNDGLMRPFKSLFRRDKFERPGIHRPRGMEDDPNKFRIINSSGMVFPEFQIKNFNADDPGCNRLAQVNHYIVGDATSYILKSHRGSAHQTNREITKRYWMKKNRNHSIERPDANLIRRVRAKMMEIDVLTNGAMSELTKKSLEIHGYTFKELLKEPKYRELYQMCIDNPVCEPAMATQARDLSEALRRNRPQYSPALVRPHRKKAKAAIPKVLGHIWIGDRKPPTKWMQTWKDHHPDWDYVVYDNDFLTSRKWRNQALIIEYFKRREFAGVSDLMRYEILYERGGFIPEADSACLKPCDELFDQAALYTVYENEERKPNMVSPFLASVPKHPILQQVVDDLHERFAQQPAILNAPWKSVGNRYLRNNVVKSNPDSLRIFSSWMFIPQQKKFPANNPDLAYAKQFLGGTFGRYQEHDEEVREKIYEEVLTKLVLKNSAVFS